MKKQFTFFLIILSFFFLFIGVKTTSAEVTDCQGWTHPTETCPIINSVSPSVVGVNDAIIIAGNNFEQEQGLNKLSFWYDDPGNINGGRSTFDATGEIMSWSDNEIRYKLNFNSWDGVLAQKNINICIKKCNNINGCDENCYDNTIYIKPLCSSYVYSPWSMCSESGQQTRTVVSSVPDNCSGGASPILNQSCDYSKVPRIISISSVWPGHDVTIEGNNFGTKYGTCLVSGHCKIIINDKIYYYFNFPISGNRDRWEDNKIIFIAPDDIANGYIQIETGYKDSYNNDYRRDSNKFYFTLTPLAPLCTINNWSCSSWGLCSSNGTQTRICSKISSCEGGTQSPATTQSCTHTPACSSDTWQCGNWGTCSPQGVQTRSCSKTYDCPSAETAAPATSQYCEAPNQPKQQTPSEDLGISNQNAIIKATVKLVCPVSSTMASQGSGTIINSSGLILTNKHVIDGTSGCLVGFIDDYDDEPYFGDRQIADIYKISSDADVAVLKLINPSNKILTAVNISQGNSSNIKLGEILTTYGYPAKFGTKITYTSGDFSGVDGNYLKTTAVIEHGNSGGGAYLKNGTFIGIPTAVVKGSLNSMGYLLSVNKVNSWLNNSTAYNYNNNNNDYSRVSALLENIDLSTLNSLGLFITGDETNNTTNNNSVDKQKTAKQPQPSQAPKESTTSEQSSPAPSDQGKENKEENKNNFGITVSEQRKSIVANAVQEIVKVAERNGGIGQEIKIIAQTQTQNQEKLETGIQKIQSRSGFARFFIGPNYSEIKSSQKLLEQNREQIQKLNEARTQIVNQGDQLQVIEQIQALEQVDQQIETLLSESQKGFSLFGWVFKLFAK